MKPNSLFLFIISLLLFCSAHAQNRCAAVEARQQLLDENLSWNAEKVTIENAISLWENTHRDGIGKRSVITIPVVVHVVYNNPVENISDAQIISQIDILNEDFRALNTEISSVPTVFQPLIADVEFEFCLASVDPNGNSTSGITRKFTANTVGIGGTVPIHYTAQGGQDAWDTEHYLNIWVAKFAGGIGGVSSFPGIGPMEEDGVEINYKQFGNINVEPPYHLGRTLTHEIGHYFNLEHPWGPHLNDCCEDDYVADTPKSCETYIGQCPTHPSVSCDMPDMFMNFMFYTNDDCMSMFSLGQKTRMLATLNIMRLGLLSNIFCEPLTTDISDPYTWIKVLSNPAKGQIHFEINNPSFSKCTVKLLDTQGRILVKKDITSGGLQKIEAEGFPQGLYFLIFQNNEKRAVHKVLVTP